MAYTNSWDNTAPLGSQAANLIDDDIRALKLDIGERLTTIFGIGTLNALDPVLPLFIKLTGSATSKILPGVTSLSLRNNADSADNIIITDAGIVTLRNNLGLSSSGDIAVVLNSTSVAVRYMSVQKSGVNRFAWGADSDAESGGNVGSSFFIRRYTDAGTSVDDPIRIARASGMVTFIDGITITGGGLTVLVGETQIVDNSTGNTVRFKSSVAGVAPIVRFERTSATARIWQLRLNTSGFFEFIDETSGTARLTIDTNGVITLGNSVTGASPLAVDRNDAAALNGLIALKRGGSSKAIIGLDASDNFSVINIAGSASNLIITDAGVVTFRNDIHFNSSTVVTLQLNTTTGATTDNTQIEFLRGGAIKWRIGTNINGTNADEFNLYSDVFGGTTLRCTTGGQFIINSASGTPNMLLDINTAAAAIGTYLIFLRAGTIKVRFGLDASDNFALLDSTGASVNLGVTNAGAVTIARGALSLGASLAATPLIIDANLAASSFNNLIAIRRQSTIRANIGLDASDSFSITDSTGNNGNLVVTNAGNVTVRGTLTIATGAAISKILSASFTWDPPSTLAGNFANTTVTVTGAAVGDPVFFDNQWLIASFDAATMSAAVTAADTVTVVFKNASTGTVDLPSKTSRVIVFHI